MFNFNITRIDPVDESGVKFDTIMYRVYFGTDYDAHYCFVAKNPRDVWLFDGFGASPIGWIALINQ